MSEYSLAFVVIAAICAILFVYPYLLYPMSLRLLRSRPIAVGAAESDGSGFTLQFCAFNEIQVMPEKVANLRQLKQRYPALEILVYDDGSTDGTYEFLCEHLDLMTAVRGPGRTGKAHGMKILAGKARGEILVFTDANVILDVDALAELASYYADPSVGGVCGSLRYVSSGDATSTEVAGGAYWRLEEWAKNRESATGSVMGADGSIFSVRRDLYPTFPDTVQDDFTVSMAVVFAGTRLVKAPTVIAYERLVAARADEIKRKVRIAARAYHTHRHIWPAVSHLRLVDRYKYLAHKVLRWWGAVPLVCGALSCLAFAISLGPRLAATVGVAGVLLFVFARITVPKLTGFFTELVVAVLATARGVFKARRGETFATWTPPVSR